MKSLLFSLILLLTAGSVSAQEVTIIDDDEWCENEGNYNRGDYSFHCEVREISLASNRDLWEVDSGINGGVSVEGWDQDEVLLRAKVYSRASTTERAEAISDGIEIETDNRIEADIPNLNEGRRDKESVTVSYQLFIPRESNLSLKTHNGGVRITNINGEVDFNVLNGGVKLTDMAGWVEGHTTNGGIEVSLAGTSWEGEGMDIRTTNGGVKINVPDAYSAQLETGTVNGSMKIDFPITVNGKINKSISTQLGDGGKNYSSAYNQWWRKSEKRIKLYIQLHVLL